MLYMFVCFVFWYIDKVWNCMELICVFYSWMHWQGVELHVMSWHVKENSPCCLNIIGSLFAVILCDDLWCCILFNLATDPRSEQNVIMHALIVLCGIEHVVHLLASYHSMSVTFFLAVISGIVICLQSTTDLTLMFCA